MISCIIFMSTNKQKLNLGNVFSTIALLGYVFNFSVLYANFAIEAIYTIVVLIRRVD
jgi:hypothetical protein